MTMVLAAAESGRFTVFPINYHKVWEMHNKAEASFWTGDGKHWDSLPDGKRHFVSHVLAFCTALDGVVLENLGVRFRKEVQIPEARAFYGRIHREHTFNLLTNAYIENAAQKHHPFSSRRREHTLHQEGPLALLWIETSQSFAERLLASRAATLRDLLAKVARPYAGAYLHQRAHLAGRGAALRLYVLALLALVSAGMCIVCGRFATDAAHCMLLVNKLEQAKLLAIVTNTARIEKEFVCNRRRHKRLSRVRPQPPPGC
eukprot:jgi/Chlat1/6110/Chrsp402S05654